MVVRPIAAVRALVAAGASKSDLCLRPATELAQPSMVALRRRQSYFLRCNTIQTQLTGTSVHEVFPNLADDMITPSGGGGPDTLNTDA